MTEQNKLIHDLTEEQRQELRQLLLAKQQELTRSIARLRSRDMEVNPDDNIEEMDQATNSQLQAVQLRVLDKEYKLLREVNRALEKFDSGEFGLCEGTEEPIGYPRLKVRPWARYGISYAEEKERMDRLASNRLPGR